MAGSEEELKSLSMKVKEESEKTGFLQLWPQFNLTSQMAQQKKKKS